MLSGKFCLLSPSGAAFRSSRPQPTCTFVLPQPVTDTADRIQCQSQGMESFLNPPRLYQAGSTSRSWDVAVLGRV